MDGTVLLDGTQLSYYRANNKGQSVWKIDAMQALSD